MIEIYNGKTKIPHNTLKFSGGELQPRVLYAPETFKSLEFGFEIKAVMTGPDDVIELALVVDALRRATDSHIPLRLLCPYLPYARQDRVCAPGESLALKVMCDFINSLKFDAVQVWDVHSDVSLALLDNVTNVPQWSFVNRRASDFINSVLVSPDAGAAKKTLECAKRLNRPMVRADKIRDPKDGSITGTTVYSEHIGGQDFLVVDDICDGGRTFVELARVLRPLTTGNLFLYVTHGIFSKGINPLLVNYDHVYTANAWPEFAVDPIEQLTIL